jgi:hypothetical protein
MHQMLERRKVIYEKKSRGELTPDHGRGRLDRDGKTKGEIIMAKVIEFYVPKTFRKPLKGDPQRCGKVLEFCPQTKKSA